MERGRRYPRISAMVSMEPFKMYPVCIHPVLGGETIHDLYVDGRVHLNGVKGTIQGWFLDVMTVYVKIRDIDADLVEMLVDPDWRTAIPTEFQSFDNDILGQRGLTGHVAWPYLCTKLVYEFYLAREQQFYDDNVPIVPLKYPTSFQNFYELADDASSDLEGEPDIITRMIEDIDNYADVLERYGIRDAAIRRMLPEILLWRSYHNYPVLAAVDDNNEIVNRNMCLWSPREARGTRKGIYCKEPGFICTFVFYRPDVVEGNKRHWMSGPFADSTDWFVPPYELADGIGTIDDAAFRAFGYLSDLHYNKFDTWLNGETFTNINPHAAGDSQLLASVAKTPEVNAAFTDIRTDYIRQGAATDIDTYLPQLLHSDYYCGASIQTRMSINTPLVI